ncbi:MAG: ABC transporter substrate-binding protein [Dehalococcoidia bacterium]|nr:ABC transporter substrate-binding protein [Dehalococcoidia bacterium]
MRRCARLTELLIALMVVGALFLASCSATSTSTPQSITTATTKPYGNIVVAADFTSGGFDAASVNVVPDFYGAIFEGLTTTGTTNQDVPDIAEKWEISTDGLTYTFYIRKGVRFHNGDYLNGADVKFSLDRMLAPDAVYKSSASWRTIIASVELKDDYTVVLRLKQPQFDLLEDVEGMTAVLPKKYIEEKGIEYFRANPVGSGAWKFVKYQPGVRLDLEANEDYWDQTKVPQFKNLTVLHVKEESTKVAMLKTGELDLATITPDSVSGLKAAGLRVTSFFGGTRYFVYAWYDVDNPGKYALGDVRVRKALQLALNRQEMLDKLLLGYGNITVVHAVSTNAYFFDPNVLKPDPYDPEQAKKLMAEAGRPSGFNMKVWDSGAGGLLSMLNQSMAGYWQKIGITPQLVPIEYTQFVTYFRPNHNPIIWDSVWSYIGYDYRDFLGMGRIYSFTKSVTKLYKNPKLDESIDKVNGMPASPERTRLAIEAAATVKNDYAAIAVVGPDQILALSSKIGGVKPKVPPLGMLFGGASYATASHAK